MAFLARGGALTAGLIMIVLGLIFLVENFYAPFSAWRLLMRYWPIIFIVIGVRRLYEYFTWQEIPPPPDKAP
jgi:hypothetical protein